MVNKNKKSFREYTPKTNMYKPQHDTLWAALVAQVKLMENKEKEKCECSQKDQEMKLNVS